MLLYLFRHADAVDSGKKGVTCDADRMLSRKGRKQTLSVARGLKRMKCFPDRIVSSPLARARETAETAARVLGPGRKVELSDALRPGADIRAIVAWLRKQHDDSIMLVGHLPDLADLASCLVAGDAGVDIALKKAAVLHISFENRVKPGEGRIEWLLRPDMLGSP